MRSLYGIGGLYPNVSKRTSVYLLVLSDGHFSIGLARDVVRRFAQHRKTFGSRLVGVSFKGVPLRDLPVVEATLIKAAERARLPLEQVEHKSHVYGTSDLDAIIDDAECAQWCNDAVAHFAKDDWPLPDVEARARSRDEQAFARFRRHALCDELIDVTANYVHHCIPARDVRRRTTGISRACPVRIARTRRDLWLFPPT